jgi:hypothetical protein
LNRFVLSAVLVIGFQHILYATTVRRMNFDDLVARADTIVVGQVIDSRAYWASDRKLILTSYTVEVAESIKGNAAHTITVTAVGGRVGNTILHVSGMPEFRAGENAIVFLERSGAYTTVVGLSQGKFTISNGEVSNSISGLSFSDGSAGQPLRLPVEEFKRQIRSRITNNK